MKKTKCCFKGAHLETEKGYRLSRAEYKLLRLVLPLLGFAFQKKSLITDFVVPTEGEVTRRMRIERIKKSADGHEGVHCIRCFKNHPIKGRDGKHVRKELEECVKPSAALKYIMKAIARLGAPIPFYSKTRRHFTGVYQGLEMTIALDHAVGLGKYSGYYMEIETILPVGSKRKAVRKALHIIGQLAESLLSEKRPTKISYRKMLMQTWSHGKVTKKKLHKVGRKKLRWAKKSYGKRLKKVGRQANKSSRHEKQRDSKGIA